ncbi:MAG: hypothetical protein AAFP82_06305, partial [Bacteroidota bacterium]
MRIFLFAFLTLFGVSSLLAQSTDNLQIAFNQSIEKDYQDQVRIHLFYNPDALIAYRLPTSLTEEGVKLKGNDYVLLVSDKEQIGFFKNSAANNIPLQLNFERGKDYYFRINRSSDGVFLGN